VQRCANFDARSLCGRVGRGQAAGAGSGGGGGGEVETAAMTRLQREATPACSATDSAPDPSNSNAAWNQPARPAPTSRPDPSSSPSSSANATMPATTTNPTEPPSSTASSNRSPQPMLDTITRRTPGPRARLIRAVLPTARRCARVRAHDRRNARAPPECRRQREPWRVYGARAIVRARPPVNETLVPQALSVVVVRRSAVLRIL
jgi:hypothetical protein